MMSDEVKTCIRCGGPIEEKHSFGSWGARAHSLSDCFAFLKPHADALAAEVARLTAERDEWEGIAETAEDDLGRFMDDLIAVVGEQVIVGDEVKFSAIVAAVAALRAQLDAAGEGWGAVSEPPPPLEFVRIVTTAHVDISGDWHMHTQPSDSDTWQPLPAPPQE